MKIVRTFASLLRQTDSSPAKAAKHKSVEKATMRVRAEAVLACLISRRSLVQIQHPQPSRKNGNTIKS